MTKCVVVVDFDLKKRKKTKNNRVLLTTGCVLVSSAGPPAVSMGGVGTKESAWESMGGGLAPRGERTDTLGRRLGVFFIAWRAVENREKKG